MWVMSLDAAQGRGADAALSPVTAALLGPVLLGEGLSTVALVGLIGVALGLWLAHR